MIDLLYLRDFNGLDECLLIDVPRLCVICGKNSSGKSTVVNAIQELHNNPSSYRLRLSREICLAVLDFAEPMRQQEDERQNGQIDTLLSLHKDEIAISSLVSSMRNTLHGISNKSREELEDFLGRFCQRSSSCVTIPPQRMVDCETHLATNVVPSPNGKGIVERLFALKNADPQTKSHASWQKIDEVFKEISEGYSFHINIDVARNDNKLFLRFEDKNGYASYAENTGLGLRDLLTIIFFLLDDQCDLLLIEEPENHLHPIWQRRLLTYLRDKTSKQIIMTSHSNIFVNPFIVDKIYRTYHDGKVHVEDSSSRALLLGELGYDVTDNLISDLVILVEGLFDKYVVLEFLHKMGIDKQYEIKVWLLGGDIMADQDLSVFVSNYNVIALVDKDDKDKNTRKVREKFVENCNKAAIPITRLKRYSLESYFSIDALKSVFKSQIPAEFKPDVGTKLWDQLGFNGKSQNLALARATTLEDIAGTDLMDFLESVETSIKSVIETLPA